MMISRWVSEELTELISDKAWLKIENKYLEAAKQAFIIFLKGLSAEGNSLKLDIKLTSVYVYKNRISNRSKEEVEAL